MGAAAIPILAEVPSENTLKDKEQVEAFFQPCLDLRVTISGIGVKEPAAPSTEASFAEDDVDLTRMMLSEMEAIAGHKRPISEYIGERARRQTSQARRSRRGGLQRRGDRKRAK